MKTLPVQFKDLSRLTLACALMTYATAGLRAAEAIVWHAESQTMDVDIDNKPLASVAADFQKATGRPIQIPPGITKTVSLKFSGKPMHEGVAKILDGLNYHSEGTGADTRIVIIDPSGTTTTTTTPGRSVASVPRPILPIAPVNTVYRPPGKDSGKGTKGVSGSGSSAGGGSADRAVEMILREAAGGGGSSRDGGSKRTSPSRPPRN